MVQNEINNLTPSKGKRASIITLTTVAILIVCTGLSFGIYSILYDISLNVLSYKIPGILFGLIIMFLGIRYLTIIPKLKKKVYNADAEFSWNNFKRVKKAKKKKSR